MKIVLDTNVFISGVFWRGSPHKILSLWANSRINLLITKKILSEYLRVLHRIDQRGDIARKWGTFALENSLILKDKELVHICRDPEDNKFLDCAITGAANYLVSGDDDLLWLERIGSTDILSPSQFLKKYKKSH